MCVLVVLFLQFPSLADRAHQEMAVVGNEYFARAGFLFQVESKTGVISVSFLP